MNFEDPIYIIRYSEIGLKGPRARNRMEQTLVKNILEGLRKKGQNAVIKREKGRIYLSSYSRDDIVSYVLERTMGIKTFSLAITGKINGLSDIVDGSVDLYSSKIHGKTYAVRSHRRGTHTFRSSDIVRGVGDALYPYSSGVDLKNPDLEIFIEVRDNRVYFFNSKIKGPGGLPLGSEGKLTALVSGGIDSPVAAWQMMKRGCPVDIVFCSLAHPQDTIGMIKSIIPLYEDWGHGYNARIHIVDCSMLIDELTLSGKYTLPNIEFKRAIYMLAKKIGLASGSCGIITGESVGQVSSQTPENLMAIQSGFDFPIYRPLISWDKDETTDLARRIGTFTGENIGEYCALFAEKPVIKAKVSDINREMVNYKLTEDILRLSITLRSSDLVEYYRTLLRENAEQTEVPEEAVLVDLGSSYGDSPIPNSVKVHPAEIREFVNRNGRDRVYLLFCKKGLQSTHWSGILRSEGIKAFHTTESKLREKLATGKVKDQY
ncbi:THUMP domain-containing protein [Oxyplasma meridianum]|uniref:tRNA sulfurtransferase n=1 Tax=Oxyplasma meridianum TaxID=3073602 RepID=A0AAX4NFF4_9ARCH